MVPWHFLCSSTCFDGGDQLIGNGGINVVTGFHVTILLLVQARALGSSLLCLWGQHEVRENEQRGLAAPTPAMVFGTNTRQAAAETGSNASFWFAASQGGSTASEAMS